MKIMFDGSLDYPQGPIQSIEFKELENDKTNLMFYYGIRPGYRMERPSTFKYNIYFESEEPNGLTEGQMPHERGNWDINFWTKVVHCCPYCVKWENDYYKTDKFTYEPYIINPKYSTISEKKYSVCYIGGMHGRHGIFQGIVGAIKDIPGYRFVCYRPGQYVTDYNVDKYQKLKINSESKISVCANLLSENSPGFFLRNMSRLPNWKNNEALKLLPEGIIPQFKVRTIEAGITKSLLLVLRDPWNVIEHTFKPDVHFIYFDSIEKLKDKINECLSNWSYCEKIIENMYQKCMSDLTIQAFYNKHLKEYDI